MIDIATNVLAPLIMLWTLYSMIRIVQFTPSSEELKKVISAIFWSSALGTIWISLNWKQGQYILTYDLFTPIGMRSWMIQILFASVGLLFALAFLSQFTTLQQNEKRVQVVILYVVLLVLVYDLAFNTLALDRVASDMLWGALIGVSYHQFRYLNQSKKKESHYEK